MKYRIPVAGDNQPSRELLSDWLAAEGTDVVAAANLEQAFAVFRDHPSRRPAGCSPGPQVGLSLAMWVREKPVILQLPLRRPGNRSSPRIGPASRSNC